MLEIQYRTIPALDLPEDVHLDPEIGTDPYYRHLNSTRRRQRLQRRK